jgi:DNA-binding CsgD family transcriptional regulator/PAS domain-containing protein
VERLRSKDTRQVLKFLRDLYVLRDKNAFTSHLVSSLPRLIHADVYTYNEMDQVRGQASYKHWPKDFTPIKDAQEILGRFAPQIPMHAQWGRGDGQALKISDFLSSCASKKTEIYNEFYYPMRIPFLMGIALPVNRRCLVTIGHHRGRKDFTERERTALNMIQPHVLQAYANAEAATHMQAELARLNHAVEQIPQGLVSVDVDGVIQWATARARKLLGDYFGAQRRGHRQLPDLLVRWMQCRQAQLDHADEQPDRIAPMIIDHGSRQLRVRMVPEGRHCLLFLEENSAEVSTEQLAHLGLSRRETEILGWIVHGKSNPEIATILSISVRTIHKHVEHIYLKLGVENRHAVISLAFEAMRGPHC